MQRFFIILTLLPLLSLLSSTDAKLTVHIIPHTHNDVGWLKNVDQYFVRSFNVFANNGVQYIIDSVMTSLSANPNRTFIYAEQAYFQRWWRQQDDETQAIVRSHLKRGALSFINGGWCMHDEATTHYIDMIDQTSLGHKFILDEFGAEHNPRIGWQIDPFGHSATQVSLLSAQLGFDALYFARLDWQEHDQRIATKDLEWVWRASPSFGPTNQIFTGAFQSGSYGPPDGLCWDQLCNDLPIQDDPRLEDYNVQSRVDLFVQTALEQASHTRGNIDTMNIMFTMGNDFTYENAAIWFKNLDKIIDYVNADGRVQTMYSNPYLYTLAKNKEPIQWNPRQGDALPYASQKYDYWTGYFTSRPALKRYVRIASDFLLIARQWETLTSPSINNINALTSPLVTLWEALGVAQHHDAITGTERQEVAYDYAIRLYRGIDSAHTYMSQLIANYTVKMSSPSITPPLFTFCPLANISICPLMQSASQVGNTVAVLIYNPLVRNVTRLISLPFNGADATVIDGRTQSIISSQVISVMKTIAIQPESAPNAIEFIAELPSIGFNTYFITTTKTISRHPSVIHRMQQMSDDTTHKEKKRETRDKVFKRKDDETSISPLKSKNTNNLLNNQHNHNTNNNNNIRRYDVSISNDYYTLNFDSTSGILSSITDLSSGRIIAFNQSFYWYASNQNNRNNVAASDAYTFTPNISTAEPYSSAEIVHIETKIGIITSEVRQIFNGWTSQIIRLTMGSPIITFEMTVGHIYTADGQGREIITRYSTAIESGGIWYTDSNGREMQKRIRNQHVAYNWDFTDEPISGNYYPINAVAWLADDDLGLAVVTDRSQGCISLHDGQLEFMLHRRLTWNVFGSVLNETDPDGQGLTVTIKHGVIIAPAQEVPARARQLQSEMFAEPHMAFTALTNASSIKQYIATHTVTTSLLSNHVTLPANLELITLQSWNPGQTLIRLSHTFGINEDKILSQPVMIDLMIFATTTTVTITELTLTANAPAGSHIPLQWNISNNNNNDRMSNEENDLFFTNSPPMTTQTLETGSTMVTINPMEVRTFLYSYS